MGMPTYGKAAAAAGVPVFHVLNIDTAKRQLGNLMNAHTCALVILAALLAAGHKRP
jgi:hypothetical protein